MSSPNPQGFIPFLLLEAIIGFLSSVFTMICLCVTATKTRRISTLNRILMALSVSNMCFLLTVCSDTLITYVWPHFGRIPYVNYLFCYFTTYGITSTSWLTFTLSFFYFLKIVPSQPGIVTKLKNMMDTITGGLLLGAELMSLVGGFLPILIPLQNSVQINSTRSQIEEMEDSIRDKVTFNNIIATLSCLPFFITIVTTVVSASLLRHYDGQMKKNIGNLNANVKDYRTAVYTMTALLTFYIFTLLVVIFITLNKMDDTTWGNWICVMLLFSFPAVQSSLLIYGNPKLKEELRKLFTIITQNIGLGQ